MNLYLFLLENKNSEKKFWFFFIIFWHIYISFKKSVYACYWIMPYSGPSRMFLSTGIKWRSIKLFNQFYDHLDT